MSFVSSLFGGGGGGERMPDYMPGQSPSEQAERRANELSQSMLEESRKQTAAAEAETARLKGIETDKQAQADKLAADEEDRRQQRIRGGGIQKFMTAGYTGYGDSRALGTGMTLGG